MVNPEYVIETERLDFYTITGHAFLYGPTTITSDSSIIYCESSGRPLAVGNNTNGTRDVGLWQFNDDTWAWLKPKLGIISKRTNPEVSTAVAAWLVYNDGWHHWNSSKHCWKGTDNDLLWTRIKQSMRGN